jgi:hypothetical protein
VTGIFQQKNPSNTFVLFIYGLFLKFYTFLHPVAPQLHKNDGVLYRGLLENVLPVNNVSPLVFSIIAYLLVYTQALYLNKIMNDQRMMVRPNFLVGMSYILLSCLFPEWSVFSPQLIINSIMIWTFAGMVKLFNAPNPKTSIYNLGLAIGIASLFGFEAIAFIFILLFALLSTRPFRLAEWIVAVMGLLTPYYFLAVYQVLTSQFSFSNFVPHFYISIKAIRQSLWIALSMFFLITPFFIGGYYIQGNLGRMLINVRKNWSLLILYIVTAALAPFANTGTIYQGWIFCLVPMAAFHACAYFYPKRRWMPSLLHWATVAYIVFIYYFLPVRNLS